MNYLQFTKEICEKLTFPQNATTCFIGVEKRLARDPALADAMEAQVNRFSRDDSVRIDECLSAVTELAGQYGENVFTLHMIFLLHCLPQAHEKYKARGISDDMWYEGLMDLKWKLQECLACKNVPGTFVAFWYEGMLRVGR